MIPEAAPASKPTDVPPRGWKEVLKATWKEAGKDNVSIIAAGVAFYIFTALVPLLTAVVLTYGLVADPATVEGHMQSITGALPQGAGDIVREQLHSMVQSSGGKTGFALLLALLIALYGATKVSTSLMTAMNIAWGVEEKRGFIKRTLISFAIVIGLVIAILAAVFAITAMGLVESLLPALGGVMHFVLQLLSFAIAAAVVMLLLAAVYRYAPNRPNAKWAWVTPGSIIATIVWALATIGFGFYVSNFGSYNATYGALGAVIVFLTWLYLTSYIILLGAEMNAVLEQEVAADATSKKEAGASKKEGSSGQSDAGAPAPAKGAKPAAAQRPRSAAKAGDPSKDEAQPASPVMLALKFGAAALASKVLGSGGGRARSGSAA